MGFSLRASICSEQVSSCLRWYFHSSPSLLPDGGSATEVIVWPDSGHSLPAQLQIPASQSLLSWPCAPSRSLAFPNYLLKHNLSPLATMAENRNVVSSGTPRRVGYPCHPPPAYPGHCWDYNRPEHCESPWDTHIIMNTVVKKSSRRWWWALLRPEYTQPVRGSAYSLEEWRLHSNYQCESSTHQSPSYLYQ